MPTNQSTNQPANQCVRFAGIVLQENLFEMIAFAKRNSLTFEVVLYLLDYFG